MIEFSGSIATVLFSCTGCFHDLTAWSLAMTLSARNQLCARSIVVLLKGMPWGWVFEAPLLAKRHDSSASLLSPAVMKSSGVSTCAWKGARSSPRLPRF